MNKLAEKHNEALLKKTLLTKKKNKFANKKDELNLTQIVSVHPC